MSASSVAGAIVIVSGAEEGGRECGEQVQPQLSGTLLQL